MNVPGFTAEASFGKAMGHYGTVVISRTGDQSVYQAQFDFAQGYAKPVPTMWPIYVLG